MSALAIDHVFALARALRGFRGVWDSENNWEIDQVPCAEGAGRSINDVDCVWGPYDLPIYARAFTARYIWSPHG